MAKEIKVAIRKGKNGETLIDVEGKKDAPIYKRLEGKMVQKVELRYLKNVCQINKIEKEEIEKIGNKDLLAYCQSCFYNLIDGTVEFIETDKSYIIKGLAENRLSTVS